jgi:hypothetical protein
LYHKRSNWSTEKEQNGRNGRKTAKQFEEMIKMIEYCLTKIPICDTIEAEGGQENVFERNGTASDGATVSKRSNVNL